jgi:hypothetical protein
MTEEGMQCSKGSKNRDSTYTVVVTRTADALSYKVLNISNATRDHQEIADDLLIVVKGLTGIPDPEREGR